MKTFIGTKVIQARPMTRGEYNDYRGWTLPENEDSEDAGMLVEYVDGGKSNDIRHNGYISWSPLEVFNRAYRPVTGITFGIAIEALKHGLKVSRSGWNGKGLWLQLHKPAPTSMMTLPFIYMCYPDDAKTTPGARVPWLASQTDMLAEDWEIIE